MIVLQITRTGRTPYHTSSWAAYDAYEKCFNTVSDAKIWLAREYYYVKTKKPCYRDLQNGESVKCGRVYCFKVKEDGTTHYEQHWVSAYDRHETPITF